MMSDILGRCYFTSIVLCIYWVCEHVRLHHIDLLAVSTQTLLSSHSYIHRVTVREWTVESGSPGCTSLTAEKSFIEITSWTITLILL